MLTISLRKIIQLFSNPITPNLRMVTFENEYKSVEIRQKKMPFRSTYAADSSVCSCSNFILFAPKGVLYFSLNILSRSGQHVGRNKSPPNFTLSRRDKTSFRIFQNVSFVKCNVKSFEQFQIFSRKIAFCMMLLLALNILDNMIYLRFSIGKCRISRLP